MTSYRSAKYFCASASCSCGVISVLAVRTGRNLVILHEGHRRPGSGSERKARGWSPRRRPATVDTAGGAWRREGTRQWSSSSTEWRRSRSRSASEGATRTQGEDELHLYAAV